MREYLKTMRKWFVILAAVLLVVSLPQTVDAASPSISQKSVTLVVGKTRQLKVKNADGKVKWRSSRLSVASVNGKGKVTAKSAGKTTITAKIGKKTYTCKVTVVNANARAKGVTFKNKTGGDFIKGVSKATVRFKLNHTSTDVKVHIQSVSGSTVYTKTFSRCRENQVYSFDWNGKNKKGKYVQSGTYRLCIVAGKTKTVPNAEVKFYTAKDFLGGDGSSSNPYQVGTLAQLKNVSKYNGRCFRQVADINGAGANFRPLSSADDPFTGVYDGNNYTITGLSFSRTGDAGLFSVIGEKGTVRRLKVSDFRFSYNEELLQVHSHGAIAGSNKGTISRCTAVNLVMVGAHGTAQGGIVGTNTGLVESCTAKACNIRTAYNGMNGAEVGGICGTNNPGGRIMDCCADSITASGRNVGGICGVNSWSQISGINGGIISGCRVSGSCSFEGENVGGICGYNTGVITDCSNETEYD